MKNFEIYASGATKNLSPNESLIWREVAKEYLESVEGKYDVKVFIPEHFFGYIHKNPKTEKQCRTFFLWHTEISQLLLVNLNQTATSVGTGMEVQKAMDFRIPIIGFGTDNVYPWIKDSCDVVFDTMEEALEYIKEYYLLF